MLYDMLDLSSYEGLNGRSLYLFLEILCSCCKQTFRVFSTCFFSLTHRNSTQHMVQLGTALWEQASVRMLHIQQEGSCTSRLTRFTSFSSRLPFSLWDIDSCCNLILSAPRVSKIISGMSKYSCNYRLGIRMDKGKL